MSGWGIIAIFLALSTAGAEQCSPEWIRGRNHVVLPNKTIAELVSGRTEVRKAMQQLVSHYEYLERKMKDKNEAGCATSLQDVQGSVAALAHEFGWPKYSGCTLVDKGGKLSPEELYESLGTLRQAAVEAGHEMADYLPKLGWSRMWDEVHENGIIRHDDKSKVYQICEVARSMGFSVKKTWSTALEFTNRASEVEMGDKRRAYYTEMLYVTNDTVRGIIKNVPQCVGNQSIPGTKRGIGSIALWGGKPSWSAFITGSLEENPALQDVLESLSANDYERGQVDETYRYSSVAILLLPALYVVLPISLIQYVDDCTTLCFILLSDLCSVIPIAIRGYELLAFYNKRHYKMVSYIYGHSSSDVLAAETWVSSCRMALRVQRFGIGLLTTAVAVLLLGLFLEAFVYRQVQKDRRVVMKTCFELRGIKGSLETLNSSFTQNNPNEMQAATEQERILKIERAIFDLEFDHGPGMTYYWSAARLLRRIEKRAHGDLSKYEAVKKWFCRAFLAEHFENEVLRARFREVRGREPTLRSKVWLAHKLNRLRRDNINRFHVELGSIRFD